MVDNLRRSLLEPGILLLLLGGWFVLPGMPGYWTAAAVAILLLPGLLRSSVRAAARPAGMARPRRMGAGHQPRLRQRSRDRAVQPDLPAAPGVAFHGRDHALHAAGFRHPAQAAGMGDGRGGRSRRAAARRPSTCTWNGRPGSASCWHCWSGWCVRPRCRPPRRVLALWIGSRGFSAWLNRAPRTMNRALEREDREWLRGHGERIWRYLPGLELVPAPTGLFPTACAKMEPSRCGCRPPISGLLLNARIAALHFGVTTLAEFISHTRQTLDRVSGLSKHRGHLLNWYDIESLKPLEPLFVSTVDSGNLAAALWTLKQAALGAGVRAARQTRPHHGNGGGTERNRLDFGRAGA